MTVLHHGRRGACAGRQHPHGDRYELGYGPIVIDTQGDIHLDGGVFDCPPYGMDRQLHGSSRRAWGA